MTPLSEVAHQDSHPLDRRLQVPSSNLRDDPRPRKQKRRSPAKQKVQEQGAGGQLAQEVGWLVNEQLGECAFLLATLHTTTPTGEPPTRKYSQDQSCEAEIKPSQYNAW